MGGVSSSSNWEDVFSSHERGTGGENPGNPEVAGTKTEEAHVRQLDPSQV